MGVPKISTGPMTVDEFYAFTDTRPDEEKWELIDGEPVLNASSSEFHQWIVTNLAFLLAAIEQQEPRTWKATVGIGVRLAEVQRPEPDVMIYPKEPPLRGVTRRDRGDVIVAFEVMSPSTSDRDLKWKRAAYIQIPPLTHYVVVAQDAIDVVVFERDRGFAERRLRSLHDVLEFPVLGISLSLKDIYRDVEFA